MSGDEKVRVYDGYNTRNDIKFGGECDDKYFRNLYFHLVKNEL